MSLTFAELETGLLVLRLLDSMNESEVKETTEDAYRILKVVTLAPYGATLAQVASICFLDEIYTQAILNILAKMNIIVSREVRGDVVYFLK